MKLGDLIAGVMLVFLTCCLGYILTHHRPAPDAQPVLPWPDDAPPAPKAKLTLVIVTGPTCPPCLRMAATTFMDARVIDRLAGINVIRTGGRAAANRYGVTEIPAYILYDAADNELRRGTGYRSAGEFLQWLDGADRRRQVGEFSPVEDAP
jgi:hypothetical protein